MRKKLLKKAVCTVLCVTMAIGLFTGCGKSNSSSSSTSVNYEEKKVLRVGMECAYAPFNWTQESKELANGDEAVPIYGTDLYCYGYDVMMAKMIAEELGWDLEIHKVEWDSIGISMDAGDYDCIIAGMSWSEEREAAYDFTSEYYFRDLCLTVKKDGKFDGLTKLSDFEGKNISVTTQLGTAYINLIPQIPDAKEAAFYETTSEAFMAVSNDVADGALLDKPTAESALLTNPDLSILDIEDLDSGSSVNVCIAVRTGDTELQSKIQGVLDKLEWNESNKDKMDEMMSEAVKLQPAAE